MVLSIFHCFRYQVFEGKPYCKRDYYEMFAFKCGGCNKAIVNNVITALKKHWHVECFVCFVSTEYCCVKTFCCISNLKTLTNWRETFLWQIFLFTASKNFVMKKSNFDIYILMSDNMIETAFVRYHLLQNYVTYCRRYDIPVTY